MRQHIDFDISKRVIKGGFALSSARLLNRGFDLIRMLTIARWLGPEEMGVYAVAAVMLTALDQLADTGLRPALIQRQGNIAPYILPGRTVLLVRGLLIGLAVYVFAPWIASFFSSPKSISIIRVMSLLPVIRGIEPLFVTIAQKDLRFGPVVALQTVSSFVSLIVGLAFAYVRPDAWAMVFSTLSAAVIMTVGGHVLSDRNSLGFSFNWRKLRDLRNFGFWIFVTGILSYIFIRGGDWVIGGLLDVRALALYQMAFLICTIATMEIGGVIAQLSLPVFSHFQNDMGRLEVAFRQSFGIISIPTFAMAGIVCACSPDFFRLVLGEQWLDALPMIPWLAIWGICAMFAGSMAGLFQALGRPKLWASTVSFMVALFALCIYPVTSMLGALGVAILMACIGVLMQLIRYQIISRMLGTSFRKMLRHVFVPALACVISVVATTSLRAWFSDMNSLYGLLLSIASMLLFYFLCLACGHRWMEPSPRDLLLRLQKISSYTDSTAPANKCLREL